MSRFSPLARGRGAWTGELELDLYVDMEKEGGTPFLPDIAADENCGQKVATITRTKSAGPPPSVASSREKADGELVLPKTFITRSGALLLFTAPSSVQLSSEQKQLLKKGIADARGTQLQNKFGTLAKFAQSVLSYGEQTYDEETGAPIPRDDFVYLDFLRQLDNNAFVDLHAKPGADPSFYLQDLRSRASSASTVAARQRGHGQGTPLPGDAPRIPESDTEQMLSADAERLVQLYSRGEFSRCGSAVSSSSHRSQAGLSSDKLGASMKSATSVGARPFSRGSDTTDWATNLTPHPPDGESVNSRPVSSKSRPLSRASGTRTPAGQNADNSDACSVGDGYAPALSDYRLLSKSPGGTAADEATGAAQPLQAPYTSGLMMVSNGGSFSMTDAVQKEDAAKVGPGSQEQDAETTSAEQESLPPTTITVEIRSRRASLTSSHSGIASEQAQSLLSGNQLLRTSLEDITLDCTDAPDPNVVDLFPGTPHTLQDNVTNEKVSHRQATKTDEDTLLGDHAHKSSSSHRNNVDALNNHSLTTQDAQPLPLLPDMSDHPESALDHTATSSHAAPPPPTIEDKGTSAAPKPIITDSATPRAPQPSHDQDSIIKQILARAPVVSRAPKPKRGSSKKSGKKSKKQKSNEGNDPVLTEEERVAKLRNILELQEKLKQQDIINQQGTPRTEDVATEKTEAEAKPEAETEGVGKEGAAADKDVKNIKGKRRGPKNKSKQKGQKPVKDENPSESPPTQETVQPEQDIVNEPSDGMMDPDDEISLVPGKGIAGYEQPDAEESEQTVGDELQAVTEGKDKSPKKTKKGRRRWSRAPDRDASKSAEAEDGDKDASGGKSGKGKSGKKVRVQEPGAELEEEDDLTEEERHRLALESDNLIFPEEAPSEDAEDADDADEKEEEEEEGGQKKTKKSKKEKKDAKDHAKEKELAQQRKQEEKQRRLMDAFELQNQIREKEHELAIKEEKAMKRKKVLEEELAYMAAQAEEARLAEQEAREALAEARRIAREEREAKRKAEIERKKQEAQKRREEEKRLTEGARKRERLMLKQIGKTNEDQEISDLEEWFEDEEQRLAAEAAADEEKFSQLERQAEEEVMARLVKEREEAEKRRRELELEAQRLAEEEEEERLRLEEEARQLEAIQFAREEEERQKQEEEKRRLLELQRLEEEERDKLRQECDKRRQAALVRREQNLESRRHLQGLAKEQGITRPWTFSYYVHWPRDTYDIPMDHRGVGSRKKRPKKVGKKGKKKKK